MALNRPARAVLAGGEKILDRILCVVGAVLFSQAPEFMQQYLQRLGGHLAEARLRLAQYETVARESGETLPNLIERFKNGSDLATAKLGGVMQVASERVIDLSAAETAIREASPFTRPFAFLRHMDMAIVQDAWTHYKSAVPMTLEGLLYAAVGLLLLLGLYHGLIRQPVAYIYQKRQARKTATQLASAPART